MADNQAAQVHIFDGIRSVQEGTVLSTDLKIADVIVIDDGIGSNTISVTGANRDLFFLVGTELFLRAGTVLDHEDISELHVAIYIDDMAIPGFPDGSLEWFIQVLDVNEPPTEFSGNDIFMEGLPRDTSIGVFDVADQDVHDTHVYELLDSDDGIFRILGDRLIIADPLRVDFEQRASHTIAVRVTDGGGHSIEREFTLSVINVDPEDVVGDDRGNIIFGGALADRLDGRDGADVLVGGGGNDLLIGGSGADDLDGGTGEDVYYVDSASDIVREAAGAVNGTQDTVISSVTFRLDTTTIAPGIEHIVLTGSANATAIGHGTFNTLTGNAGNNYLAGLGGNDTINGAAGDDFIFGGDGKDTLTGGVGNDRFYYHFIADSRSKTSSRDVITDFSQSAATNDDWIDLAATDANGAVAGNQAFIWLGTGAFTGAAGELRYFQDVANNRTIIEGNVRVTADSPGPEFSLELTGLYTLTAGATNAFDIIL